MVCTCKGSVLKFGGILINSLITRRKIFYVIDGILGNGCKRIDRSFNLCQSDINLLGVGNTVLCQNRIHVSPRDRIRVDDTDGTTNTSG